MSVATLHNIKYHQNSTCTVLTYVSLYCYMSAITIVMYTVERKLLAVENFDESLFKMYLTGKKLTNAWRL